MSRLIDTDLGQFRQVIDGVRKRFLFQCPECMEMLPMDEAILNGTAPIDHNSRLVVDTICPFRGKREFGKALVSTIQALVLMGYKPHHDENESYYEPST